MPEAGQVQQHLWRAAVWRHRCDPLGHLWKKKGNAETWKDPWNISCENAFEQVLLFALSFEEKSDRRDQSWFSFTVHSPQEKLKPRRQWEPLVRPPLKLKTGANVIMPLWGSPHVDSSLLDWITDTPSPPAAHPNLDSSSHPQTQQPTHIPTHIPSK